jgi:opacity protein-like surface antigen
MVAFRLLALLAVVSAGATARAEPLLQPPSPVPAPNDDAPPPPLVPPASDTLGGHFVLGVNGGFVVPWGDLSEDASATDLGSGTGLGVDLGYGLSRSVVIGVWGQFANFAKSTECGADPDSDPSCTATSYALGPFVRYHIVQGTRFDPWMLAGLGYRAMSVKSSSGTVDYAGVEWLRLALGGDYYPFGNVGFGPFVELDVGVFGTRPPESGGMTPHFSIVSGLRIVLDLPGK